MKTHLITIGCILGFIFIPYLLGAFLKYLTNIPSEDDIILKWIAGIYVIAALGVLALIYYGAYQIVKGTNKHS